MSNTKRLSISLTNEQNAILSATATYLKRSKAEVIRLMIDQHLGTPETISKRLREKNRSIWEKIIKAILP